MEVALIYLLITISFDSNLSLFFLEFYPIPIALRVQNKKNKKKFALRVELYETNTTTTTTNNNKMIYSLILGQNFYFRSIQIYP